MNPNTKSLHYCLNTLIKSYHQPIEVKALDFYLWNADWCQIDMIPFFPVQLNPFTTRISSGYVPISYLLLGIQIHKDSSNKVSLWCIDTREGLGTQMNSLQASTYFSTGVLFRSTCLDDVKQITTILSTSNHTKDLSYLIMLILETWLILMALAFIPALLKF